MRVSQQFSPILMALFFATAGLFLFLFSTLDLVSDQFSFVALTLLVLTYLLLEVRRLRRSHPDRWLVNPVVLCSFITFGLGYGVTNAIFFMSESQLEVLGLVPEVTPSMVKLMWLVLVGAVAMWLGYWSQIAAWFSRPEAVARLHARFLPRGKSLSPVALPALVSVAVGARFIQIDLGVFGYSGTYDRLIEMGAITQYLTLVSGLGKLALVLAALQYYSPMNPRGGIWLYSILAIEVVFGFLSGFKGQVVMPFLTVAFCQYLRTGKFAKHWVVIAVACVIAAYAVIEPFRAARNEDAGFKGNDIISIATTMIDAVVRSARSGDDNTSLEMSIASRANLSYIGSFGIAFSDENATLPPGSPEFLADIFWAPLHAWLPRLVWESKPLENRGLWYNQVVMGMTHFSSTAMGPFTYLYFAGGVVAVVLGFYSLGIVQRTLFYLLARGNSAPGGAVFMSMLATISVIDSSFNGVIVTLCRELPLVVLMQFLVFRSRGSESAIAPAFNRHEKKAFIP